MMADQGNRFQEVWLNKRFPDLDDTQFEQWRRILEERTGMQISHARKSYLKTSLSLRMQEIGCQDYQQYFEKIVSGVNGSVEWYKLIDHLTVQETRFFRDPASIKILKDYLQLKAQQKKEAMHIWSVGCSTGEESYSLAMLARECFSNTNNQADFGITATDISQPAIKKAMQAVYNQRKIQGLDERLIKKYFQPLPQGRWQVADQLKDRVCFTRLNVLELVHSPIKQVDVVYCQNLLIYFRKWRRKDIVNQLVDKLEPGGLLILGLGELTDWRHPQMTKIPNEQILAFLKRK